LASKRRTTTVGVVVGSVPPPAVRTTTVGVVVGSVPPPAVRTTTVGVVVGYYIQTQPQPAQPSSLFVHGKNVVIWIDDALGTCRNLSGDKNSVAIAWLRNDPEILTFGENTVQRLAGLQDATLSGAGIFNTTNTTGIDAVFSGLMASSANTRIQLAPAGSVSGCPLYTACYQMSKYDIVGPVGGVAAVSWEFQIASGSLTSGCVIL
jgi:hypothetical protein